MFVLARLAYQDAYRELNVGGVATGFSSFSITELSKSNLVEDLYYYTNFEVRVNSGGVLSPITFTNDFDYYLMDDYTITYAKGYNLSVFERTGAVCLIGNTLAEKLGVEPGDEITLMSDDLYSFMIQMQEDEDFDFYGNEEDFQSAQEAAFLRILGVTKKRVRCMLVFKQMILCAAAIALVAGGLALFGGDLFTRSIETLGFCFILYFLGSICGRGI